MTKHCLLGWLAIGITTVHAHAADQDFQQSIQPMLDKYCNTCHSTAKQKGDLDLERFASLVEVKKQPKVWEGVLEQLGNNEMPPKGKPQISAEQKEQLIAWVRATLDEVALANAGDPGPVVLRRLSNVEYTYTIRDLTGVESLDPAREFPVDGAAGEGFTNAGAALVMSPALLTKYLDAAKEVASHAMLLPTGLQFSPHTSPRDWTDEKLAQIRALYAAFTDSGGDTELSLQEIKVSTNADGRLPVGKYVTALVVAREDLLSGKASLVSLAQSRGLTLKYLTKLWQALTDTRSSLVLDDIRQRFRSASPDNPAPVVKAIQDWQQTLWRFASIGHIGKKNGPKGWQEASTPLGAQHELRLKLTAPAAGKAVKLYLCSHDALSSDAKGSVVWSNARLVTKGAKDTPLPDIIKDQAGSIIEISLPADQIKDSEFVIASDLAASSDPEAALQVQVLTAPPTNLAVLTAGHADSALAKGQWSDNNLRTTHSAPILVRDGSAVRRQFETAFNDFRQLFPLALCYSKIVPVDEVVTLTLFYREDDQLKRLMLDDAQSKTLDRLWEELRFISESPLKQVDVFEQLYQFATQDANPAAFEPMREPIMQAAEAFKKQQADAEPLQLQAALDFARLAWRRPLTSSEEAELRTLYQKLRTQEMPHATAARMLLVRALVAPAFLYRGEKAAPGLKAAPVNDWELATRLSYFLWASAPDEELSACAAAGTLRQPEILSAQTRRMVKDSRVRRLATEFGCQWLHVRDLETLDEKSERHFPTFTQVRGAMQEEAVRFFIDLFQEDRSVLCLLDADYTFMNGDLASHYGLELKSADWQRVDGLHTKGRGGILAFASTLAKQSGASRTSPILRGNWLSEVILGDKLPRPPKGVPILPEEAPQGLTERQLIERHSSDAACARCHQRIDPFGFALEGFDAIGRARSADTKATLPDGTTFSGLEGLRTYLLTTRRDDFQRQFCRKLLGYALGRSVQLSDKPLLDTLLALLNAGDHRASIALDLIIHSPQFLQVRGRDSLTSN